MNMIEKAARAIVHARHLFYNGEAGSDFVWHSVGPEVQECALLEARAAVFALREPTDAMVDAGCRDDTWGWLETAFTVMMDEILKDDDK